MNARHLLPLLLATLTAACATTGHAPDAATYIVVRHAEKASDSERDPGLSDTGHARAHALAGVLADRDLAAILSTDYRRTRQTVQPLADAQRIAPTIYDANADAATFAAELRAAHPHGSVLVAGHSNTVPGIVAALCACAVEPMPDTEYDRLSTIHVDADGRARLVVARYGTASPLPSLSP